MAGLASLILVPPLCEFPSTKIDFLKTPKRDRPAGCRKVAHLRPSALGVTARCGWEHAIISARLPGKVLR